MIDVGHRHRLEHGQDDAEKDIERPRPVDDRGPVYLARYRGDEGAIEDDRIDVGGRQPELAIRGSTREL